MLIGAGRLLLHTFLRVRAHVRSRLFPALRSAFSRRRMRLSTASFVLTAMLGTAFAVTHGFGPATPPRPSERPRSVAVDDAPIVDGSAHVTVSSPVAGHHFA